MSDAIWIGVDPGGRDNFGVAILQPNSPAKTWCVDCADKAVEIIAQNTGSAPAGVGIDAPMWWSSGQSSDRLVDQWIRRKYGLSGGNVQSANSLRGAALVQGAMFAYRIRQLYPEINITESHPKAVWVALQSANWGQFCTRFSISTTLLGHQEHERDAVIAAICAREGFQGHWKNDLSTKRHPSELDPSSYWLKPIHYFWPDA
jgi:predicted nuclease with RNAse H fold